MQQPVKTNDAEQVGKLSLKQLASVLVKHYGLHEGLYEASVDIQTGIGNIGMTSASIYPGAVFGVTGVGLRKAKIAALHTVDAKVVNPKVAAVAQARPQVSIQATTSLPAKFMPAAKPTIGKPANKSKSKK